MTAIVFNCSYNGLAILQDLGRRGINTVALDSSRSVGTYSRYADFKRCENPEQNESAFIESLLTLGKQSGEKPTLFPTNDEWAAAVSKNKKRLEPYFELCVADWDVVRKVLKKHEFYDWAGKKHYPVPKTWSFSEVNDIPDAAFPIAAKPKYRRLTKSERSDAETDKFDGDFRLRVFKERSEAVRFYQRHQSISDHIIFQEYISGMANRMFTIGVYADANNDVRGIFTGRKIRGFPPTIGDCNVGKEWEVPEHLIQTVEELVEDLEYTGIAEFEFKKDSNTEEFRLIEINPRSWSWIGITPVSGVSLPWLAYQDLNGERIPERTRNDPTQNPISWIRLLEDLPNSVLFNQFYGFHDEALTPPEWYRDMQKRNVTTAEFAYDDPLPGIYSLIVAAKSVGVKVKDGFF